MDINEIINQLGENRAQYFNAVSPPIIQSSNFAFPNLDEFREAFADELDNHIYTRGNNPTVEILRKKIAALEKAEDALVFSSGSGAIASAILANVAAGDHIVCVESPYSWTTKLLTDYLPKFKVTHTFVDGKDLEVLEAAIQPNTKMLYLESPNSLTFAIQDIKPCADIAKKHGLISCIDNSHCSPIFQNPIPLGIDIVVHSGTKYLNGHSDVVCGAVCSTHTMIRHIFEKQLMMLGNVISPNDAFLIIRGLRTLPLRMNRTDQSGRIIANYLEAHPKVTSVLHPLLPSFPQYDLAKKQMSGAGGLFSFHIKAEKMEQVEAFVDHIRCFLMAVSWGGHESLILPSVAFYKVRGKRNSHVPWTLIRLYIGLEDPEWLIEDLEQAFEYV